MTVVATISGNKKTGVPIGVGGFQGGSGSIQGGSARPIQGTGPTIQGSSPRLQVTTNPQNYQFGSTSPVTTNDSSRNTSLVDGSGGGGSSFTDTSAARGATQKNIDAVDIVLNNSLANISSEFDRIMRQYADEAALNKKAYDDEVFSNEDTRSRTIQSALLSAAQGSRGLNAVLASMGALGGTGKVLAGRAVASEANRDIGDGNRVFDKNATQLTNAYSATSQDEKNRKAEAEAAKKNEEAAAKSQAAKDRQSLYEKMAGYWAAAGNNAEAAKYLGLVGDLADDVAGAPRATAAYTPRNIKFEAGELGSYLAGANDMTVKTSGGSQTAQPGAINSPLYSLSRKREELA